MLTLSFVVLGLVSGATKLPPIRNGGDSLVAPGQLTPAEGRRRVDASDHFDDDEDMECFADKMDHEWRRYWGAAGSLSFTPPTLDSEMKLIFKSLNSDYHLRNAKCGEKGCHVETSKNGVDTIFSPAPWVGQVTPFVYYVNFGTGAWKTEENKLDILTELEVYYCYPKTLMYWDAENDLAGTMANVAGFLAQAAWESGDFKFCEEQMHVTSDPKTHKTTGRKLLGGSYYVITHLNAGCTQRELYADLTSDYRACDKDPEMKVSVTATALECIPTSENALSQSAGCCWWGRGAMQSTGPSNIGAFYNDIIERTGDYDGDVVNVCDNPSLLCSDSYPDLRWESAFYFWATTVQSDDCFSAARDAYTEAFDNDAVSGTCKKFSMGIGGMVNQGKWDKHAHGEAGRVERFETIMTALQGKMEEYEDSTENDDLPSDKECTGNDAVDWIFWKADLESVAKVNVAASKYDWSSFCSSLKKMI